MSGHSKWNNIKRKKGAADAAKGQIFTKLGREIQMAVRAGGPDPEVNRSLKDIIAKAKSNNMPNDSIQRSISKASGGGGEELEVIQYEGYGPGGVAVMVRTLSDNRTRTAGDVRHIFDRFGGNLGTNGCVAFQFEEKGSLILDRERYTDEETVMMEALDAGAEDVDVEDDYFEIVTSPESYISVVDAMEAKGYVFEESTLAPQPITMTKLNDPEMIENMERLIDTLEENDDVTDVYHNWEQEEA